LRPGFQPTFRSVCADDMLSPRTCQAIPPASFVLRLPHFTPTRVTECLPMLPGLWDSFHFQFLGPVVIDRPQLLKWSVIVAPQPVHSAARFARAFFWPQTNSEPSGNIRRNCIFAKSFRFRSYANCPILHYFGANKSFRIRSYRHPARNSFRFHSYKNTGGWHPLPSNSVHRSGSVSLCLGGKSSPALFRLSTFDCRPAASSPCLCGKSSRFSGLWSLLHLF
jgi:hypothetical protein